ncbi:placenta-specific gene 8 protein-like [Ruditapes philippinarum]|uniref:placenta-specific gene 8 protein-like n=1 Tax=Ruditapes philippinarum TaxID=129788 RepID=UPI00295AA7A8|nr:placenta-specific gene 8 protein-like [Ruditapes philippinarum]
MSSPPPNYDRRDPRYHPQDRGPPPNICTDLQLPINHNAQGQMHSNPSFDHGHMMPPPQHSTTVVINQQPSVQNDRILGSKDGHREWSSGLFSCFDDVGKCMWGWCCPSCVLIDISARLGECAFVTSCVPGSLVTIRTRVRTLGGIRGSICKDCMVIECCSFCAMCQIHRELEYMGL